MQWLPDTIDALTRMLQEAGVIGSVAFLMAITVAVLLWKHLGQMLDVAKAGVTAKLISDKEIVDHLKSQGETLKDISSSNIAIAQRVGKLPSDHPECKAQSAKEITELFKVVLSKGGVNLSDAEVEIIVKHRQAVVDATAKQTGDIPARRDSDKR